MLMIKTDLQRWLQSWYVMVLLLLAIAIWQQAPDSSQSPWLAGLILWLVAALPLWPFAWAVFRPSSQGMILFSFAQMLFFAIAVMLAATPESRQWGLALSAASALLLALTIAQIGHYKYLSKQRSAPRQ